MKKLMHKLTNSVKKLAYKAMCAVKRLTTLVRPALANSRGVGYVDTFNYAG